MTRKFFDKPSLIVALVAAALTLAGCSTDWSRGSSMGRDALTLAGADLSDETISKVTVLGPDNLIVKQGATRGVTVTGDNDVIGNIRYKMEGSTLRIGRSKEGSSWSAKNIATITLTLPQLTALSLSGSGNADVEEMVGEKASVAVSGSGDVSVRSLTARSVEGSIAGSGNVKLSGSGEFADFSIAGSGDIDGRDYKAEKLDISIAGSGNVDAQSDGEVDASIAGSGDVRIRGKAKCKTSSMGSGKVSCG